MKMEEPRSNDQYVRPRWARVASTSCQLSFLISTRVGPSALSTMPSRRCFSSSMSVG